MVLNCPYCTCPYQASFSHGEVFQHDIADGWDHPKLTVLLLGLQTRVLPDGLLTLHCLLVPVHLHCKMWPARVQTGQIHHGAAKHQLCQAHRTGLALRCWQQGQYRSYPCQTSHGSCRLLSAGACTWRWLWRNSTITQKYDSFPALSFLTSSTILSLISRRQFSYPDF